MYDNDVSVSWRPDFGCKWERIKDGFKSTDEAWTWVARQSGKYASGLFMVINNPVLNDQGQIIRNSMVPA